MFDEYDEFQLFDVDLVTPVRWVKVTLDGRQEPDPDDYRGTTFTELLAYGEQEAVAVPEGTFSGRWLTGVGGGGDQGNRIELIQNGSLVTGCGIAGGSSFTISGGIERPAALCRQRRHHCVVAVVNSEDHLVGALIGRSFTRLIGTPGGAETSCSPVTGETAILHGINFDVDKDDIRPDAVLDQRHLGRQGQQSSRRTRALPLTRHLMLSLCA